MGVSYIRRWTFDPGADVLLNIESVNILDLQPPSAIVGVGAGAVCIAGEFENGPYATPTEVTSPNDVSGTFGMLGFTYGGIPSQYPCAVSRKADNAVLPEYWNGNGFVQLSGKQFARLFIVRVDTSVGSVQFTRLAFITGAAEFAYNMTSGEVLGLDLGSGETLSTFTGAFAFVDSGAGTYPTTFAGGETLTLGYDATTNFTTVFLATDQSMAQVIARINQYAGFLFASNCVASVGSITGGTGYTVAPTATFSAPQNPNGIAATGTATVSGGAVTGVTITSPGSGYTAAPTVTFGGPGTGAAGTPALFTTKFALTSRQQGTGAAVRVVSGSGSVISDLGLTVAATAGTGNVANIAAVTFSEARTIITEAITGTTVEQDSSDEIRISNSGTPGTGTITVGPSTTAIALGFVIGQTNSAAAGVAGTIPAGTVVKADSTHIFVTAQDVAVTAAGAGPYLVKVRHAVDDTTGLAATAGSITTVVNPPDLGAFTVINLAPTTAALTDAQIDAQYAIALTSTLAVNSVAKQTNLIYSARQSNVLRSQLKLNAITASASGCYGRMAVVRTPMNTLSSVAQSTNAAPGVGTARNERVVYCYPQANTYVPLIATVGLNGGAGFTADGNVDVGADGFLAAICSQLPPEEDPGQETPFATTVNGLESGANVQGFVMQDYIAFKAAGICALRVDDGLAFFQSGCTSVDPLVYPNLVNIARRRMADYLQDSIAIAMVSFGKKLSTFMRRNAMESEIRVFMTGMLGNAITGAGQRIDSFSLAVKNNTTSTLGQGRFRLTLKARTLNSLKSIEIETFIGEQVIPDAA
jgi:hypothetical protein